MWFRKAKPVELRDGEVVEVTGIVRAREPMVTAAISGCECVGYETYVRLVPSIFWETKFDERAFNVVQHAIARSTTARRISKFELELSTQHVVVEGFPAIRLALSPRSLTGQLDRERAFLAEHGAGLLSLTTVEVRIEAGDTLAVTGLVEIGPMPGESGYRDTATRIRIVPPRGRSIEIREAR